MATDPVTAGPSQISGSPEHPGAAATSDWTQALAAGAPAKPFTGPTDSIAYLSSGGAPPSSENYGRTLPDLIISNTTDTGRGISVTAIPSLAGGVASIKLDGQELVATGGHGASVQFDLHPSDPAKGLTASEGDNPTEAGSQDNDGGAAPYLNSSSSGLINYWAGLTPDGNPQISTVTNMAYYVPQGDTSAYNGDVSKYQAPNGPVAGKTSDFVLQKWMTLGMTVNGTYDPDVLAVDSEVTSPRDVPDLNEEFVAYLQSSLKNEKFYDPATDTMFNKTPGEANPDRKNGFNDSTTSPVVRIFSDDSGQYAIGMMTSPAPIDPKEPSAPTVYTATDADRASDPNYTFQSRTMWSEHDFTDVKAGDTVEAHTYLVIGSVNRIKEVAAQFDKQWGLMS